MDEKQKAEMIAKAENVEAIADFFNSWWSTADLYETAAKASTAVIDILHRHGITHDDAKELMDLFNQHIMMIDLIKPFERKGGEI